MIMPVRKVLQKGFPLCGRTFGKGGSMISLKEKLAEIKRKIGVKNIFLLLLAGGLLLISSASGIFRAKEEDTPHGGTSFMSAGTAVQAAEKTELELWEEKLTALLSGVKGVGKAEVMITLSDNGEKIVLKESKSSTDSLNETDRNGGTRTNITSGKEEKVVYEAGSVPFVTQEFAAKVAGILVVCEGGGNADVVVDIVSAVEALFGVPAHRIVVLEMK